MRSLNVRLEQIQLLIDRIQHHNPKESGADFALYEKLLTLSETFDYPYGRALAHGSLALYHQQQQNDEDYFLHLERAQQESAAKGYFDVQLLCLELESWRNAQQCDEVTALTLLLQGREIAEQTKDRHAQAKMDMAMGKLFCASGAHEDAAQLYRQALATLEQVPAGKTTHTRRCILLNLQYLACKEGRLELARGYQAQGRALNCDTEELQLFSLAADSHLLLQTDPLGQGKAQTLALLEQLRRSKLESHRLSGVYFLLLEQLLELGLRDQASWCLGQLDALYGGAPQRTILRIQRGKLRFAQLFGEVDPLLYQRVYETTCRGETAHSQSTAQSFQNLIALYRSQQARDLLLEEQTDLQAAVSIDELTRVYNRRYLGKLITKLVQDDRVQTLGYIMVDVDFFKEYNDFYGHSQGDTALMTVASLLERCLPPGAYAARYGGDEFTCLLADCSQEELVDFVCRVQGALWEQNLAHARSAIADRLTLTFGIHWEQSPHGCQEARLLQQADEALYRAKRAGRNTYAVSAQGRDA